MCFSLDWLMQLLIWLVIVCAIVGILRIVIPYVLSQLGVGGGVLMAIINILIWAVVAIFVIYIAFAIIGCLGGAVHMPIGRH